METAFLLGLAAIAIFILIIIAIDEKIDSCRNRIKALEVILMDLKNAAAAEEKEKAKKEALSPVDTKITSYTVGKCPVCGSYLFDGNEFCKECGQRIDWGTKMGEVK